MAKVSTGSALSSPLLQPGAKFSNDGYGLWTATLTFAIDKLGSSASFYRGANCPVSAFSFCKMHKSAVQLGSLDLDTWTADYVGIDPSKNSGTRTDVQVAGSQGLTSENITTHPNFFELASGLGFSGSPIAGVGTGSLATPAYPAVAGTTPPEYSGNNGATFEAATGRKFLGFKKPEFKGYYGKSNYLAPQTSFSGHFYTTSSSTVQGMIARVGKTSGNGAFNSIDLLPSYMGTSFTVSGKNQLLLAQVSTEDYGLLYKVQYEVRFNREGYESAVYAAN
jgi:hypothetical protein